MNPLQRGLRFRVTDATRLVSAFLLLLSTYPTAMLSFPDVDQPQQQAPPQGSLTPDQFTSPAAGSCVTMTDPDICAPFSDRVRSISPTRLSRTLAPASSFSLEAYILSLMDAELFREYYGCRNVSSVSEVRYARSFACVSTLAAAASQCPLNQFVSWSATRCAMYVESLRDAFSRCGPWQEQWWGPEMEGFQQRRALALKNAEQGCIALGAAENIQGTVVAVSSELNTCGYGADAASFASSYCAQVNPSDSCCSQLSFPGENDNDKLYLILGIVFGVVGLLLICGIIFFFVKRRGSKGARSKKASKGDGKHTFAEDPMYNNDVPKFLPWARNADAEIIPPGPSVANVSIAPPEGQTSSSAHIAAPTLNHVMDETIEPQYEQEVSLAQPLLATPPAPSTDTLSQQHSSPPFTPQVVTPTEQSVTSASSHNFSTSAAQVSASSFNTASSSSTSMPQMPTTKVEVSSPRPAEKVRPLSSVGSIHSTANKRHSMAASLQTQYQHVQDTSNAESFTTTEQLVSQAVAASVTMTIQEALLDDTEHEDKSTQTDPKSSKLKSILRTPQMLRRLSTRDRPPIPPPKNPHFIAIFNYKKNLSDEIDLIEGDEVKIIHSFDDGWMRVFNNRTGHTGVVPAVCLKEILQ